MRIAQGPGTADQRRKAEAGGSQPVPGMMPRVKRPVMKRASARDKGRNPVDGVSSSLLLCGSFISNGLG